MKKIWLHSFFWTCFLTGFSGVFFVVRSSTPVFAQAPETRTATPGGPAPFVTNIFDGEPAINVRTGPSTIFYPNPCGSLPFGATASALGSSPAHEWIQIVFTNCPNGVGWIYAPNVSLSPGYLPIIEPPPTATPIATATIDPTLAAAFNIQPTATRLPTFTPPPPLIIPTYANQNQIAPAGFPLGGTIFAIAMLGLIVLTISFYSRR